MAKSGGSGGARVRHRVVGGWHRWKGKDKFHSMNNMSKPRTRHYSLICSHCGQLYDDDGLILDCSAEHEPALLRTQYAAREFNPVIDRDGIFRYEHWLPVTSPQQGGGRTIVYQSSGLGGLLGLPNLWIAFNGFWPERGATFETATFKELEAATVLSRLPRSGGILTIASSGNTGAAFARACSRWRVPCLIIIPERSLQRFRFADPLDPCVKLVLLDDGDYPDAIELTAEVSRRPAFTPEGGVKNVGRRDGLGTVLLSAFEQARRLPSYYFQAVGSGTGAIAVLEAAKRIRDTTSEADLPRLMLCQNLPFTPIFDAWRMRDHTVPGPTDKYRSAIKQVYADELTNWMPPYAIRGGVYDSLVESRGDVLITDNLAAQAAADTFLKLEGIDIEPAAGVAVACLQAAVAQGRVERDADVLLNITGGGRRRLASEYSLTQAVPRLRLSRKFITEDTLDQIAELCGVS
jgi:cysteate synthase